jgi:hypothetical protein
LKGFNNEEFKGQETNAINSYESQGNRLSRFLVAYFSQKSSSLFGREKPDHFSVFELIVDKRGRTWTWVVCTAEGDVVMQGTERSRAAAKYKADRALFLLLLSAPYRSKRQVVGG